MNIIGIICEYNPFHNGHLYHINKIKELYPDSLLIAVISTSFCQRGEVSILNKWDKTRICLENKIDLVIELPFVFSSQSADIFAKGALSILNSLKVEKLVFGSESNDIETLKELANIQINNKDYEDLVKEYLDQGINYPTAMAKGLKELTNIEINTPNDLLGISYVKEIIKNNYNIEAITIKRTNDYHDINITNSVISASSVRNLIKENGNIKDFVPNNVEEYIYKNVNIWSYLKLKIVADQNILSNYQTVDEGIENRLIKYINECDNLNDFIAKIKTKRYTYNKLNRMFIHILTSFTKEEAKNNNISYIRVLGFNISGKTYLNKIKKGINYKIISSYKNFDNEMLNIEYRITSIYALLVNDSRLIKKELDKPIII